MENKLALNIKETAEVLSMSRQSVYKLIQHDNTFPVFHIGKSVRISADGLKEWVKKQTEENAS